MGHSHFRPQIEFIKVRSNEPLDFIGRFERLGEDFDTLASNVPPINPLGHENPSPHDSYRSYYDDRTRKIVAELYRGDIEAFNYAF